MVASSREQAKESKCGKGFLEWEQFLWILQVLSGLSPGGEKKSMGSLRGCERTAYAMNSRNKVVWFSYRYREYPIQYLLIPTTKVSTTGREKHLGTEVYLNNDLFKKKKKKSRFVNLPLLEPSY